MRLFVLAIFNAIFKYKYVNVQFLGKLSILLIDVNSIKVQRKKDSWHPTNNTHKYIVAVSSSAMQCYHTGSAKYNLLHPDLGTILLQKRSFQYFTVLCQGLRLYGEAWQLLSEKRASLMSPCGLLLACLDTKCESCRNGITKILH